MIRLFVVLGGLAIGIALWLVWNVLEELGR